MSEPLIKKASKKNSLLTRILIGAVVVIAIVAIGVIAFKFISYNQMGGIPTDETHAQVAISSPPTGLLLEAGESVLVETAAIGSTSFTSMELWINGKLMGVQAAPSGGVHPFQTFFSWRPIEPGIHTLIASAIDVDGNKVISEQVVVFVNNIETGIELISFDSPSVLPAPEGGGYSPSVGPESDDSSGPAGIWSASIGDWITSLTADTKPIAPELVVSAGECTADLQINDLSEEEEGFIVYRQTSISNIWTQITTLSSQSEFEWITYSDVRIYGAVTYYVTAFNSQGESTSNLVLVNIDPADCSSEGEKPTAGTISVAIQIPDLMAEKVYCYQSTDGINWSRWPQLGFLAPDEGGTQVGGLIMHLMQNGLAGETIIPQLSLYMECWGWAGGELQLLGRLGSEELEPRVNNNQTIPGSGISAEVSLDISNLPVLGDLFPIGLESNWIGELPVELIQMVAVSAPSLEVPRVYLSLTTDPETCGQHLPPDAQNFLGQLLYCFPYPEHDPNLGATIPQPYLVWEFDFFEPNCVGGVGESCKNYWELLDLAEESGGQVGFDVQSISGSVINTWKVTEPDLTMFVAPPLKCLGDSQFSVRLWYQQGSEGEGLYSQDPTLGKYEEMIFYGPYSNEVSIPCDSSLDLDASLIEPTEIPVQYLDITFESVYFSQLDDGDLTEWFVESAEQSVELYGYFRVIAPSMGWWQIPYCFYPDISKCETSAYWTGTRRNLNVADWEEDEELDLFVVQGDSYKSKYIELEYRELCQSTNKYTCLHEGKRTPYETRNNTIRVFVEEGDALIFEVMLIDYDESSGDDVVCVGTKMTSSKTLEEWAEADDWQVTLSSDYHTESGYCSHIKILIDALWSN